MKQYTVFVYTDDNVDLRFPEKKYDCNTSEEVSKIIKDCSEGGSDIKRIGVYINYYSGV